MMVMREHDPNDDPFAALSQEEPTLTLMDFGSGGAAIQKTSTTTDEKEEAPSEASESSTNEASSSVEKEA
jgi:hypothetical protein